MNNERENVLLCTINDSDSLAQVLSTYALYETMQTLGYRPVVFDNVCRLDTSLSKYVRTRCSIGGFMDAFTILLTGSERRWRCNEKETVDTCFLNFGKENVKRIAYAPSFGGTCELPLGPKNAAFFMLQKFHGISAADSNTLSILNLDFCIDAEKVCNPILLLDQYPHFTEKEMEGLFIFTFFEEHDSQKQKAAEMAEEILRYRVMDFSADSVNTADNTADDFISAIKKSALIITDSSAVTHLAIVYKKPFMVLVSRQRNEAWECVSTLDYLGITERAVYIEEDVREKKYLCRKPIRYGLVDYRLNELKAKSIRWLEKNLKE